MLERIQYIKGIGLFHSANGSPHALRKVTLIYSENGRGKSTLSSILRSAATGNAALLNARQTIGGSETPAVCLQFGNGYRVSFTNTGWTEKRPELLVFDFDFIDKNVHSGTKVSTEHRKNLLEFALGADAVVARVEVETQTAESLSESAQVKTIEEALKGFHVGTTLAKFEVMSVSQDIPMQIDSLHRRIAAARAIEAISRLRVPSPLQTLALNLDSLFSMFDENLDTVHDAAEKIVQKHIDNLGTLQVEGWLSEGTAFNIENHCPYCYQNTTGNYLIKAYRQYFDTNYVALKKKVVDCIPRLHESLSDAKINSFIEGVQVINAILAPWRELVEINPIDFDVPEMLTHIQTLRALVITLAEKKQANVAVSVACEQEKLLAKELLRKLLQPIEVINIEVASALKVIEDFRNASSAEDIPQLEKDIQNLNLMMSRQSIEVATLLEQLAAARQRKSISDGKKDVARETLSTIMVSTLTEFRTAINGLLRDFGAAFSIEAMGANFLGGTPRSEYGLKLRGDSIPLEGEEPSFATALSEGDKRTLAFAFFIARTLRDPKLNESIVVLDDPISSLDINRKSHTREVIKHISQLAEQTIVLSHDCYFIRDLRDLIAKDDDSQMALLHLKHTKFDYTNFESLEVDKECESPYYKHHRTLIDFVNNGNGDYLQVAKSIRPMLEGYLHRRFPGHISRGVMFGSVITLIDSVTTPDPLVFAKPLVAKLKQINSYVWKFHHDTNPDGADTAQTTRDEVKTYSKSALSIVYGELP